jgi:hypothetical protein
MTADVITHCRCVTVAIKEAIRLMTERDTATSK